MPYGKLITRFMTGGHDIFITCPAKSMHLEPFGLSVRAFCGTGDENIIPTCRSAGNYYIIWSTGHYYISASAPQNQQNDPCAQQIHRSAWASTQSDQNLRCSPEEGLGP